MSIYLEFPSIQNYPEYCPLGSSIADLSCWEVKAIEEVVFEKDQETSAETKS